jgi:hypothetical protein
MPTTSGCKRGSGSEKGCVQRLETTRRLLQEVSDKEISSLPQESTRDGSANDTKRSPLHGRNTQDNPCRATSPALPAKRTQRTQCQRRCCNQKVRSKEQHWRMAREGQTGKDYPHATLEALRLEQVCKMFCITPTATRYVPPSPTSTAAPRGNPHAPCCSDALPRHSVLLHLDGERCLTSRGSDARSDAAHAHDHTRSMRHTPNTPQAAREPRPHRCTSCQKHEISHQRSASFTIYIEVRLSCPYS